MKLSDVIADFINSMLSDGDEVELQRSELAGRFNCAPSQINYVIETRFSPERGFYVESRRGGGGYIRITRLQLSQADRIMHVVNSIGGELDGGTARAMLQNMVQSGALSSSQAELIHAAVSDKTLSVLPRELRDTVRAAIFKNMLLVTRT